MKEVGIVILNYETYNETIACIESIIKFEIEYAAIVIVDNASSNNSYDFLKSYYDTFSNVHVIKARKNYGFAKGNNIGIHYLKKVNSEIQYILLLNSDVLIISPTYVADMIKCCTRKVGIVGSKIILPYEVEQAGEKEDLSIKKLLNQYIRMWCHYHFIYCPIKETSPHYDSLRLHGCAIMLTPVFFEHYTGLWPFTFLYREEMILSIMLEKVNLELKICETPIYHKASKTTNHFFGVFSKMRSGYELKSFRQEIVVKLLPYKIIQKLIRRYGW